MFLLELVLSPASSKLRRNLLSRELTPKGWWMVVSFPTFLNDRVLIIIQECFKGVGHEGDDLLECVQEVAVGGIEDSPDLYVGD